MGVRETHACDLGVRLFVRLFVRSSRIDFRELVRDLFAIYKTRIWLQQVVPTGGKKVMVDYDA